MFRPFIRRLLVGVAAVPVLSAAVPAAATTTAAASTVKVFAASATAGSVARREALGGGGACYSERTDWTFGAADTSTDEVRWRGCWRARAAALRTIASEEAAPAETTDSAAEPQAPRGAPVADGAMPVRGRPGTHERQNIRTAPNDDVEARTDDA